MSDTLYRQWLILKMIPRYPMKIDTRMVLTRLHDQGIKATMRSVQRDFRRLEAVFPLVCDEHKPPGWSYGKDANGFEIPNMDPHAALTFRLVGEFLSSMLPPATLAYLKPYVKRAREVLEAETRTTLRTWPKKIRVIPRWQTLKPPDVKPEVVEAVYRAVLNRRKMKVLYCKRGEREAEEYQTNPQALVFRDRFAYLICSLFKYENPVQLVLHRMEKAEVVDEPAKELKGFDLDEYIKEGEMGFRLGDKPIPLKVLFDRKAAAVLFEAPVSRDQKLEEVEDEDGDDKGDKVLLKATVPDTVLMRAWLLSYGEFARVLAPKALVDWFRKTVEVMAEGYRKAVGGRIG